MTTLAESRPAASANAETESPAAAPGAPIAFVPMEQCLCLRCESAIPRECIAANVVREDSLNPVRQVVKIYCEHCNVVYQLTRELRGGGWQIAGPVELMADRRKRDAFIARIEHVRGVIRRPPSPQAC
jgi:hypothetical protein